VQAGAGLELLLLIASIAVAVGALFRFRRRLHCDTPLRLAGVLLWLLLPVVLSIRHWQPLYSHYFFATFPAPFLLIGAALAPIRYPIARLTDLVKIGGLVAVVLVAFLQVASTVGGLTYQASVDADPCLPTPLGRVESTEQEVAQLGHAFGSTRAIIELDAQGAKPMAYLLRSDFPDVYLATPILPNETPWLVGEVGLGPSVAVGAPWRSSVDVGRVLTRIEHPNARYAEHITLVDAAFSSEPRPDQNVFAALTWLVDADANSNRSVVWQVELRDATGRVFAPSTSENHVPGELRGQRMVSWFSVDARRDVLPAELAPGAYRFVIQLLDASSTPAVPIPWVNPLGDSAGTVELPIQLGPLRHCDL
jgi:hypothetical protein